jgi:hypothetical protein
MLLSNDTTTRKKASFDTSEERSSDRLSRARWQILRLHTQSRTCPEPTYAIEEVKTKYRRRPGGLYSGNSK